MKIKDDGIHFLLKRISKNNDQDAFRLFYEHYYLRVYRFSSYFVKSSQLVEEVVSDVFYAIWQNRKKLVGIDNFEGYLFTIIRNRAFFYLKKENRFSFGEIDQTSKERVFHHEDPEYLAIDKEFTSAFDKAVADLPERCRTIFLMARGEKLKYKEIAEILGISEKTVNAQMVLAIKKLSKRLGHMIYFLL